jgi:glycosyltransferase A (GT-A) superfamily protein (DUF2064 family)
VNQNFFGLLAKYPQPGLVKTRLAHAVGKECAAGLYKTIVEKVIRQTRPQGNDYERVIFYAPPSDEELFRGWLAGERLTSAALWQMH